jgi:hypothetical protein
MLQHRDNEARTRAISSRTRAHVSSPLTRQTVALIIQQRVRAADLHPREFAGHTLRSGYATQAAWDGHRPTEIAATTVTKTKRVIAHYVRAGRGRGRGRGDIGHML